MFINFFFLVFIILIISLIVVLVSLYIRAERQKKKISEISLERYRSYIELSTEAIYCFEGPKPMPINLPIDIQMKLIFNFAKLSECNKAFANFYGFASPKEAIGTRMKDIIPQDNPTKIALLKNFIENGYKTKGFITVAKYKNGEEIYVRNTIVGIVKDNKLYRAWGTFQDVTDLIKLQNKYIDIASRYQNLLNNVNSIVLHWNLDGVILFLNNYGLNFFGYTYDELIGKNVIGTIVPKMESDSKRDLEQLMAEILKDPKKFEYNENENIKKDGTRVWIAWRNTPIFDENNKLVEVLSVGIDMTKRYLAEREAKALWSLFQSFIDISPDTIAMKDTKGRYIFCNKAEIELFHLYDIDYKGKTAFEIAELKPEFKDTLLNCYNSERIALEERTPQQFIEVVHLADGSKKIFQVNNYPLFYPDGSLQGLAVIGRDITTEKLAFEALKQSEEKYKKLIESLPLPTFVISNNRIVFYNFLAKILFTQLRIQPESPSFDIFSLIPKEDLEKLYLELNNEGALLNQIETQIQIDGQQRHFVVTGVPIIFESQDSFLVVLNEVTEIKKYNEYLEKLSKELEEERNKLKEVNLQLELANKELKELNLTKDKFFSIIAHDLRNPVSGLKNLIDEFYKSFELLDKNELNSFFQALTLSSTKLYELLEELLTWARTQTGSLKLNPNPIDIYFVAESVTSLFTNLVNQKGLVLLQKIPQGTFAYADNFCANTILRNLVSNAIKFSYPGGIIKISSEDVLIEGKPFVKVEVSDTGVGIPYELQDKMFQLDNPITSIGTQGEQGTGLGLIVTRELVKLSKGNIWFESQPNVGTKFYFTLPKEA